MEEESVVMERALPINLCMQKMHALYIAWKLLTVLKLMVVWLLTALLNSLSLLRCRAPSLKNRTSSKPAYYEAAEYRSNVMTEANNDGLSDTERNGKTDAFQSRDCLRVKQNPIGECLLDVCEDNSEFETSGTIPKSGSNDVYYRLDSKKEFESYCQEIAVLQNVATDLYNTGKSDEAKKLDCLDLESLFNPRTTSRQVCDDSSVSNSVEPVTEEEGSFYLHSLFSLKMDARPGRHGQGLSSNPNAELSPASSEAEDEEVNLASVKYLFTKRDSLSSSAGSRSQSDDEYGKETKTSEANSEAESEADSKADSEANSDASSEQNSEANSEADFDADSYADSEVYFDVGTVDIGMLSVPSVKSSASRTHNPLEVRDNNAYKFYRDDKLQQLVYALHQDNPKQLLNVLGILKPLKGEFNARRKYSSKDMCLHKRGYTSKEVMDRHVSEAASHSERWRVAMAETMLLQLKKEKITLMFAEGLLHKISSLGSVRCLEALLREGFDPNVCHVGKDLCKTPLICAAEAGEVAAVDMLLKNGALAEIPNVEGASVLHRACAFGRFDVIRRLMEVPEVSEITPLDNSGKTPLAALASTVNTLDDVCNFYDVFHVLKEAGAKVWSKSKSGESLLHTYVSHSEWLSHEVTEAFLPRLTDMCPKLDARSVSVSVRYNVREPSATCNRVSCACCFVYRWDVLEQGPTALCLAATMLGSPDTVMILLQANASIEIKHVVAIEQLRQDWRELESVERTVLQQVCPEFATTVSVNSPFPSHMLVTPFQRAMLKGHYVNAAMLIEAGHHVPYLVHAESVRGFLTKPTDTDDNDDSLLQLLPCLESPPTLQWWCCRSVRSRLPKGHDTCRKAVDRLPISAASRRYIALQHLKDLIPET